LARPPPVAHWNSHCRSNSVALACVSVCVEGEGKRNAISNADEWTFQLHLYRSNLCTCLRPCMKPYYFRTSLRPPFTDLKSLASPTTTWSSGQEKSMGSLKEFTKPLHWYSVHCARGGCSRATQTSSKYRKSLRMSALILSICSCPATPSVFWAVATIKHLKNCDCTLQTLQRKVGVADQELLITC